MNLCTTLQQRWETCRAPVPHHPRYAVQGRERCINPHVRQLTREHVGHYLRDIAEHTGLRFRYAYSGMAGRGRFPGMCAGRQSFYVCSPCQLWFSCCWNAPEGFEELPPASVGS